MTAEPLDRSSAVRPVEEIRADLAGVDWVLRGTPGVPAGTLTRLVRDVPGLLVEVARLEGDLGVALREAEAARERAHAVVQLHQRIDPPDLNAGFCTGCEFTWPCRTIRALDGEAYR